jgi:transcription elongation factor SPT5
LAQVDWVEVSQNQVCLRLLPRIDYRKKRGVLKDQDDDLDDDEELSSFKASQNKRSSKNRPPQAPFDIEKMHELGAETSTDGDFTVCEGQRYRRGLLYKVFPLNAVVSIKIRYF